MSRWASSLGVTVAVAAILGLVGACSGANTSGTTNPPPQSQTQQAGYAAAEDCQKFIQLFQQSSKALQGGPSDMREYANNMKGLAVTLTDPNLRTAANETAEYFEQQASLKDHNLSEKSPDVNLFSDASQKMQACIPH